jgi:predicted secreted protein
MPAKAGRKVLFLWKELADTEYSAASGLRAKSLTINNNAIDITSDDDNGFQTFLADVSALRSVELKVSGVLKDSTLLAKVGLEDSIDVRIVFPGIAHVDVEARFTSAELSGEQEDPATFDYSFSGSGSFVIGNGTPV